MYQFSSVQSLSRVLLFATPWIVACQASLSITNSWSSSKLMSIELVMPSSHLILCRPLLLLPSIPPSIRVFSNESTLCMRWLKYWSFSFSISSSSEHPGLISLQSKGLSRVFSKAPHKLPHRHQIFYNIEEPKLWQNELMNKKTPSRGDWAQCFLRSSWLLLILKLRQAHVQNF